MTEKTISGVHVSPGSAETLVRRGGITNHRLIAYSLSNISAKNYEDRLMCIEVILCYVIVVCFRCSVHGEAVYLMLLSGDFSQSVVSSSSSAGQAGTS